MESSKRCCITKQTTEDVVFWQQHIAAHAASGLSKSAYCHLHQVDYARFIYWSRKTANIPQTTPNPSLVAIKLLANNSSLPATLCTLHLKKGSYLQIHDAQLLPVIFDRLN